MNRESSQEPRTDVRAEGAPHVALVTGGSRGIGAAICRTLAERGAAVLIAARGRDACEQLADEITSAGGRAWALSLDVSAEDSIAQAVQEARILTDSIGPVDWIVNNAGIADTAPLLMKGGGTTELFERHFAVNFHGARRVTEALLGDMRAAKYGRIVNVASSAGLRGYAYVSAYCASKFALVGYTLAAALELESTGVTMNAVCPHYADTPMLAASIERLVKMTGRTPEEAQDYFRAQNPGGELVTCEAVADAVVGLLEGGANGQLVELDGSSDARILTPNAPMGGSQ